VRIVILTILTLFSFSLPVSAQKKQITIVIDPGHGGSDPGHLPNNDNLLQEKDLNLKISKYLGSYFEKYLQNVTVVYTRTDDSYPSLDARVDQANSINADYFISIHCNGNEKTAIHGTETHVHSMSLKKSVDLGRSIENQFSKRAGRKSRGVKDQSDLQHSLQVLKFTNMTSVLIECGFLTNDAEAAFLNTTYGQEIIASAIFRGVRENMESEYPQIAFRKPAPTNTTQSDGSTSETESNSTTYTIQIASSKSPIDVTKDPSFKKLNSTVTRTELNTSSAYKYVYTVGEYTSKEDADAALKTIKTQGFSDAFVVKR